MCGTPGQQSSRRATTLPAKWPFKRWTSPHLLRTCWLLGPEMAGSACGILGAGVHFPAFSAVTLLSAFGRASAIQSCLQVLRPVSRCLSVHMYSRGQLGGRFQSGSVAGGSRTNWGCTCVYSRAPKTLVIQSAGGQHAEQGTVPHFAGKGWTLRHC